VNLKYEYLKNRNHRLLQDYEKEGKSSVSPFHHLNANSPIKEKEKHREPIYENIRIPPNNNFHYISYD